MTVEKAREIFRNSKAAMNWLAAAWKKRGNEKGDLVKGEKVLARGTLYVIEGNKAAVKYADDDRFDFCENSIATSYFWCTIEKHNIISTVSQNCAEVGVTMTKVNYTADVRAKRSKKEKY